MHSLNQKVFLAALGAVLATPALAQPTRHHRQVQDDYSVTQRAPAAQYAAPNEEYPNGAVKSGSEENVESGAAFNQGS